MISPRLVVRRAAREDMLDIFEHIALDHPVAARRFLAAANETFLRLLEMPMVGRRWNTSRRHLEDVRVWRVKGFENHLIFYRAIDDAIEILRVLHGARDCDAILDEPDMT